MATAVFNKKTQSGNTYNLNEIITLTGFGSYKITYELKSDGKGISIKDASLIIEDWFYGIFDVIVLAKEMGIEAVARGFVYSFTSSLENFSKNENLADNLKSTKENWNSIIGEEKKKDSIKDPIKDSIKGR